MSIHYQSLWGIVGIPLVFFLLGRRSSRASLRVVGSCFLLQLLFATCFFFFQKDLSVLDTFNLPLRALEAATSQASIFLFGYLSGPPFPFEVAQPESNFIVVFRVLPLVVVVSGLSALLYHWKVIPWLVRAMARALHRVTRTRGHLGLGSAASFFFGTIETPLLLKPVLKHFSPGEFLALMSCTLSTVAGTVIVLYASILKDVFPASLTHFVMASLLSIPAALMLSNLWMPFETTADGSEPVELPPSLYGSSLEALIEGSYEGLMVVFRIVSTLLVLFTLVYLAQKAVAFLSHGTSLSQVVGRMLTPVMYAVGFSPTSCGAAGELMATKMILNEFVAFMDLARLEGGMREAEKVVLSYGLCGFANLGSVGILIGGMKKLMPEKNYNGLILRAFVVGNAATLMTASWAGVFLLAL